MKAAAFLLMIAAAASVDAFEVWSFRTGMTLDQAAAVAKQQGYDYARPQGSPTEFQTVLYERRHAGGTFETGYAAQFCDGRLSVISRVYKGDMATLFELLRELRPTYGAPTVETASSLSDGRVRGMTFKFQPKAQDTASVIVTLNVGSETSFGIQATHRNATLCDTGRAGTPQLQ